MDKQFGAEIKIINKAFQPRILVIFYNFEEIFNILFSYLNNYRILG